MKIAISAEGKETTSLLDERFGRCNYFHIYDDNGQLLKVLDNNGLTANGGAGIAASQQIIDEHVDVLITGVLGPNAFNMIFRAGIRAYTCPSMAIASALKQYQSGQLEAIVQKGPAHGGLH